MKNHLYSFTAVVFANTYTISAFLACTENKFLGVAKEQLFHELRKNLKQTTHKLEIKKIKQWPFLLFFLCM